MRAAIAGLAAAVLMAVAPTSHAQSASQPGVSLAEALEDDRAFAQGVLDEIIRGAPGYVRAALGQHSVDVEVDPRLNSGCSTLGNPAVSFEVGREYRIRLCWLSLRAIAETVRGMIHLEMEARGRGLETVPAAWTGTFMQTQVRLHSSLRTALLNGEPASASLCRSPTLVAYLAAAGTPSGRCAQADAATLERARTWARGHDKKAAARMATLHDDRDVLEVEKDIVRRWVYRDVIAHEIGHLLPKPPPQARAADNPVTDALMTELVADSFVMHTPQDDGGLVAQTLIAFWDELRRQGRRGAPEPEHVLARRNALALFAACRSVLDAPKQPEDAALGETRDACLVVRAAFGGQSPELLKELAPR